MIGHFSDPYSDELFYSVGGRYSQRMGFPSKRSIISDLQGPFAAVAVVDLPGHLDQLVFALPPGHRYTADRLIDGHTQLPFFSPFLPSDRVDRLRRDMCGGNAGAIHTRLGIIASSVPVNRFLRYCPACAEHDRILWGETYWHRLAQLPGVEVCPTHEVFLQNSLVDVKSRRTRHEFVPADRSIPPTKSRSLDRSNRCHQVLLRIAQDAEWLLSQHHFVQGPERIRGRYLNLLAERGLATFRGQVRQAKLRAEFIDCYRPEVLRFLGCKVNDGADYDWLADILRTRRRAHHPLHHLLVMQFLGCTAAEFFNLTINAHPFGKGPWLCLNHASGHYGQPVAQECHVVFDKFDGSPVGTFHCASCGFAYCRKGPDQTKDDQFRIGKILSFGEVWGKCLSDSWFDAGMSLRDVARRLGVDPLTVKRHASDMGLPFLRPGIILPMTEVPSKPIKEESGAAVGTDLETYRNSWLSALNRHPKAGVKKLRMELGAVYAWLYRHDREWLIAQTIARKSQVSRRDRVDWARRDYELANAIKFSARRLRNADGYPIRITAGALARDIGQYALLQKKIDKLPVTAQALSREVETREEFAVRKIRWAAERFQEEGVQLKRWRLIRRANMRPEIAISVQVAKCIDEVLESDGLSVGYSNVA